ncbi:MAG: CPBP family intramembrane metalloprotease, partial [Treponema sp.]|nr:CPBP family intramembrane metalloprotease [Treponema sp.]
MNKINKTILFLILTFVISYSLAAIYWLIKDNFDAQIGFVVLGVIYMFIPFVSAVIVKTIHNEPIMSGLLISFKINRWFVIAWLIIPVIVLVSLGVSVLLPGISYNPEMTGLLDRYEGITAEEIEDFKNQMNSLPINFFLLTVIQGLIAGVTVNALAAFGEETGWRAFLLKAFRERNFFTAALLIGVIWGIWHAPLILMGHNYPQHPVTGVFMMIAFCVLLSPLFQYLVIKSKSVIAAAIAHGTLNAFAGLSIIATSGGNDLTAGMTGIAGFITLAVFTAGFFIFD